MFIPVLNTNTLFEGLWKMNLITFIDNMAHLIVLAYIYYAK